METGEFDYAWNLQLAPDVIKKMESAGKAQFKRRTQRPLHIEIETWMGDDERRGTRRTQM